MALSVTCLQTVRQASDVDKNLVKVGSVSDSDSMLEQCMIIIVKFDFLARYSTLLVAS